MPRRVVGGLIQAAAPLTDPSTPIDKIREAAIDAHIPFIEEAGRRGVQILGLQEVFRNGGTNCMHAENGGVIDGLAFNDLQAISTDHCPFCMKEQKTLGEGDFSKIPNGAPGIETRMSLVYDGGVRAGSGSFLRRSPR